MTRNCENFVILHFSPHPDDECIGAPGALLHMAASGCRIVNVACTLGKDQDVERRRREVTLACERLGFELRIIEPRLKYSKNDDRKAAEEALKERVRLLIEEYEPSIIVSPSVHDRHYGHELVARAVRAGAEASGRLPLTWWMWGLWADLPLPNVLVPLSAAVMDRMVHALEAHQGEVSRNDYTKVIRGRASMNSCLGYERVFGFGAQGGEAEYVELLMEATLEMGGGWALTQPRTIADDPVSSHTRINRWLDRTSVAAQVERGNAELE